MSGFDFRREVQQTFCKKTLNVFIAEAMSEFPNTVYDVFLRTGKMADDRICCVVSFSVKQIKTFITYK